MIASSDPVRGMGSKSRWSIGHFLREKRSAQDSKVLPARSAVSPFHSVSIIPGRGACVRANQCSGTRYLSRQAPRLPLPACDAAECNCRFKHHNDRRAGPRRRTDIGFMPGTFNGAERRQARGRRAEDRY
jgi:hypothetical protein